MPPAFQVSATARRCGAVAQHGGRRSLGERFACHETLNERPSADRSLGTAPMPGPSGSPLPKNRLVVPPLISSIAVGVQVGSVIVPGCVFPIAAAFVNVTLPNRVSGTGVQRPLGVQFEGASAIHSAEDTSSCCVSVIVLENRVCRVRFFRLIVTVWPLTSTAALMRSPARILSGIGTDAAGTISHQAS